MTLGIEAMMEAYEEELKECEFSKSYPGGMTLHFSPVGSTGYYIGTLTAYNSDGEKSEYAIPFNDFIDVINEIESLLRAYRTNNFTGQLVGNGATGVIKNFLFDKKVHRIFFLDEDKVLPFVKTFMSQERTRNRAVDVVVLF